MPVSSFGTIDIGDFTTSTGDASVCIGLHNIARGFSVAIGKETVAGTRATVIVIVHLLAHKLILVCTDMIMCQVELLPIFSVLTEPIVKPILFY